MTAHQGCAAVTGGHSGDEPDRGNQPADHRQPSAAPQAAQTRASRSGQLARRRSWLYRPDSKWRRARTQERRRPAGPARTGWWWYGPSPTTPAGRGRRPRRWCHRGSGRPHPPSGGRQRLKVERHPEPRGAGQEHPERQHEVSQAAAATVRPARRYQPRPRLVRPGD